MNKGTDLADTWMVKLRRHPIIAVLILVATILGGVLGFVRDTGDFWDWIIGRLKTPEIVSLVLSPSAIGFHEVRDKIFAASQEEVRTFQPDFPFAIGPRAILLVTINNPTNDDLILTAVTYVVEEASSVKGGPSGPLNALTTYHHKIVHQKGEQSKDLAPPFRVAAGSAASLELEVSSASPGDGLGWLLQLRFASNLGNFSTERFQLYLPKNGTVPAPRAVAPGPRQRPSTQTPDILKTRVEVAIPEPKYRDCIFKKAGVFADIEHLDHLDRDVLFIRAGGHSLDEFAKRNTETDPPAAYGKILTRRKMELLLKLIKSKAVCQG